MVNAAISFIGSEALACRELSHPAIDDVAFSAALPVEPSVFT